MHPHDGRLKLAGPPLLAVAGRHQRMRAVEEIAVVEEEVPQEQYLCHVARRELRLLLGVEVDDIPIHQLDDWPFNGVAARQGSRFPRPLDLELRADGDVPVEHVHGGRMDAGGGIPRCPAAAVAQPEAAGGEGMRQDRPPGHEVLDVGVVGRQSPIFPVGGFRL
ncbi:MAG: hypothetical protein QT04_C0061G0004 [archaeon GW2011_AR11]|nr:MAG: hypothetical protein QT04_C0061G0004 [archaeon GW2011_AR11]